jgi:hypothetical protein
MKKIIIVLIVLAAAGYYYYTTTQSKPSEMEKAMLGQWKSDTENTDLYFNQNHTLYIAAFGTTFQEIKWKITEESPQFPLI